MTRYCADEFIDRNAIADSKDIIIDKKVSLLYDLCMLVKKKKNRDPREDAVRELLEKCETPMQMDNLLHDVVRYDCTVTQLLKKKGLLN